MRENRFTVQRLKEVLRENWFWLALLLLTDVICALFLWLSDAEAFAVLSGLLLFSSAVIFFGTVLFLCRKEAGKERLFREFLDTPDEFHTESALSGSGAREKRQIRAVREVLAGNRKALLAETARRTGYEEYIETWAHEIKTPLSLITLMLDSRSSEMSETVRKRLDCAQIQIQEYVEQMLYYSRLRSSHKDYVFERTDLSEACREVLEEYQMFLDTYGFQVEEEYTALPVLTDRKSFAFIFRQVLANAVKYRKPDDPAPHLLIRSVPEEDGGVCLTVEDNGIGVMRRDLPFLFDRGFCSENGESGRKSTGMGLYLVKQLADDLKIRVDLNSEYGKGFAVSFSFPDIFRTHATKGNSNDSYSYTN